VGEFLEDLAALAVVVDAEGASRILTDVHRIATVYRPTSYDAAYLELALRRNLPLATLDEELLDACYIKLLRPTSTESVNKRGVSSRFGRDNLVKAEIDRKTIAVKTDRGAGDVTKRHDATASQTLDPIRGSCRNDCVEHTVGDLSVDRSRNDAISAAAGHDRTPLVTLAVPSASRTMIGATPPKPTNRLSSASM
jgi:hypothetical protein